MHARSALLRALSLTALAGCYGAEASDACVVAPLAAPPTCETHPSLCGRPVRADLRQPNPGYAVDLVFVPEGYAASELGDFHARVSSLLRDLEADRGSIVGRDPARFNRYVIDLIARQGVTVSDGAFDTPLRGCLGRDTITPAGTPLLVVNADLARFTARAHVPAADVVVVLMNHRGARANAPRLRGFEEDLGLALLGRQHGARVLDHELGHALVHLSDEYVDGGDCWGEGSPPPGLARSPGDWWSELAESPNLTQDPSGARWSALVRGARAGGARHARCVYHPTDACRMGDDDARPFCPVCDDAIERLLRDVRAGVDNRAPRCGLYVAAQTVDGQRVVCPFTRGPGGPVRIAVRGANDEALLDGVYDPAAVSLTPSITLGRGCVRIPPPSEERTLRVHCWSVTGAHAENALTLRP
jgi:IgA Peptidase M64